MMRPSHVPHVSTRRKVLGALLDAAPVLAQAGGRAAHVAAPEPAPGQTVRPGRFTFLNWWSAIPGRQALMDDVARRRRERRPELELEFVAQAGTTGFREKFVTAQAANDPFDAAFSSIIYARDLYDAGQLLELDPYIKRAPIRSRTPARPRCSSPASSGCTPPWRSSSRSRRPARTT